MNSINGVVVKGENSNFYYNIFKSIDSLKISQNQHVGSKPTHPFFGIDKVDLQQTTEDLKKLSLECMFKDELNDPNVKCIGFKEVKYHLIPEVELQNYLEFLEELFPNPAILLNTRDLKETLKSGLNKNRNPFELKRNHIAFEKKVLSLYKDRHNFFHVKYNDLIKNGDHLKELFNFLGADYNKEEIQNVLNTKHSYVGEKNCQFYNRWPFKKVSN